MSSRDNVETVPRITIRMDAHTDIRICTRCIIDTTVPGAVFDPDGICNFCKLQDRMEEVFPNDERGERILAGIIERIKRQGKNRKYDCIVGISGGRDSTYTLYMAKNVWGLRPLAVHFNDGFGNPVAGRNMLEATKKLGVELRTITSDWRESKDIRIAFLKSSCLNIEAATDLGIAAAMYGVAVKENIKYILIGQSFRTEGIAPLVWNYLDGYFVRKVHQRFGTVPMRPWTPENPGFNLDLHHMFYYAVLKRIKTITPLYYHNYERQKVDKLLADELNWVNTGAHYYDDLYQSLMFYYERVKYNVDRRKYNYSALIRSGQLSRDVALKRVKEPYVIEDPKVIDLCIKRLGLPRDDFERLLKMPPKTFRDFPNRYGLMKTAKPLVRLLSALNLVPRVTYDKYYHCG